MKIKSLHIYSHDGRRRDIAFHTDGLNVITGRSSTGKSALSDIIEYCMGRSTFNIPEGVIRDKVHWYAIIYEFASEEVLVAKQAPSPGAISSSPAMVRRGVDLEAPHPSELKANTDDDAVVSLLSRLLGIRDNRTDVPLESSRNSYRVTAQHTYYYLFQKQSIVANKDQLLYRQNEQFQPQTIRDTLPILLGSSSDSRLELERLLKEAKRELKLLSKQRALADDAGADVAQRAIGLLAEARTVGLVSDDVERDSPVATLRQLLLWTPEAGRDPASDTSNGLHAQLASLRRERREVQATTYAARQFAKQASGFETEGSEQLARLATIRALPRNAATGDWQWPFAERDLGLETPLADSLLAELNSLEAELSSVARQRPDLDAYIELNEGLISELNRQISEIEVELASRIEAEEALRQLESRNAAAARVVGRVSMFLEGVRDEHEGEREDAEYRHLVRRVEELERQIGEEEEDDRLASIMNSISSMLSSYVRQLKAEFAEFPARLSLNQLTVVFDRPDRPVPMSRTGGGENHLAYHLAALLALHRFAAANRRPIPRFLLIDQPTQVYFPSEAAYRGADGSVETTERDADLVAVRRLFELLRRYTLEDVPGFQIIVTEHANLRDDWFQAALVEEPWTKPPALVPDDWPSSS